MKNRYEIIIYNDKAGANPSKIRFNYNSIDHEFARDYGKEIAKLVFPVKPVDEHLICVHVEFREANICS